MYVHIYLQVSTNKSGWKRKEWTVETSLQKKLAGAYNRSWHVRCIALHIHTQCSQDSHKFFKIMNSVDRNVKFVIIMEHFDGILSNLMYNSYIYSIYIYIGFSVCFFFFWLHVVHLYTRMYVCTDWKMKVKVNLHVNPNMRHDRKWGGNPKPCTGYYKSV